MNKIFKVIWNHATQSWIVTSEISKSHGKTASGKSGGFAISHISGVRFAYTAIASTLLFVLSETTLAATVADGTGTNSIIIKGATSTATAIGADSLAAGTNAAANGKSAVAIGTNSEATGENATAYGNMATATKNNATAFGSLSQATAQSATAVGHKSQATADHATALGSIANASAARTVAVGYNVTASQIDAVAVGSNAIANQANAVAVGVNAKAQNNSNIAIGNLANATGATSAISIGRESVASNTSTVAMGYKAQASGTSAIAVGSGSLASGISAIAIGNGSDAAGERTTVIGSRNGNVAASYSAIVGIGNAITSTTDVQVYGNTNTISRSNTYVLGSNNTVSGATESAVIAGRQNTMSGTNGVAVGRLNTVAGSSAVAIGQSSQALGTDGIALGNKAYANTGQNAIALGGLTYADQFGTALGARTSVKGDQGLAAATGAVVEGPRAVAVGSYSFAGPEDAVALGHNTAATGSRAVAIGAGSVVSGARSGAWGIATNGGQPQNNTTDRSFVGGADSYAIGNKNIIGNTSSDSFVLGNNVKLGATGASIAITNVAGKDGTTNASTRTNTVNYTGATAITGAVALGSDTSVTVNNGVALGKSSVAGTAAGQVGTDPLSAVADKTGATWTSTLSAVSVGDFANNKTRQITSVAAGTQDTDAVNVAQLKAAGFTLAASNTGGGEATTVADDKIQNGETVTVDAGKNIKVTHTANTVSIATKDDVAFTTVTTTDAAGNKTVLNGTGITITPTGAANPVSLTNAGLNNGGNVISNVGAGKASTDAVNVSQLTPLATALGVNVDPNSGIVAAPSFVVTKTDGSTYAGETTIQGALNNIGTEIQKGITFTGNSGQAVKRLGETFNIKGTLSDTATASDKNIRTEVDSNGVMSIKLAESPKFGNVTINDAGKITGVTAGTANTDAVNVAQLNNKTATTPLTVGNTGAVDTPADTSKLATAGDIANAINNAGFTLTTAKTTDGELGATATNELINAGDTVTVEADKNIKVTQTNGKISIATKDVVSFNSVTAGTGTNAVVLDDKGVNVGGKTYISDAGLNANSKVITNVADGTADKDAVNVSQLKAAQAAATSKVEGDQGVTVTSSANNDGTTTYTVAAKTDGTTIKVDSNGNLTANTTTLAPATDGKVGTPTNPNALVTASDIANAINNSGFNLQANGDTASLVKAGDKVQFLNGDNIEITRNGNDITVATAKDVSFNSVTAGTGTNQVVLDNDGVKVGGNTYISNAGLNANDKKVTNVANGDVTSASKDAINGSQLHAVSTATKNLIGGNATVNSDGTVTASNIGGTGATTIDNAIKTVKTTVKSTDNTIKVTANPADATNGTVFDISVDSQKLAESAQLPVVYTDADGNKVYKVGGKFTKDPTGQDATKEVSAANVIASMQNADGTTSTATKLANIAKGDVSSNSKDAINGSQLFAQGEGVKNIIGGNTTYDPTTGTYTNNNIGGTGKGNINDAIQTVNTKADTNATEIAKGLNFGANDQTATSNTAINRKLGDTIGIKGGITDTSTATSGENVITRTDTNGNINIELAKNAKFDSVTTGNTLVDNSGITIKVPTGGTTSDVKLTAGGLDNGGNKITNVANGDITSTSKDAINGSQLRNTAGDIAGIIGGNATVDNAGNVTASNIGGTTATTIDDAIKTVKTTVKSTDNTIKVTANTANANDGTVFDISVDSQKLAESAQLPVVYTKADGTKVYKVGNSFFDNKEGTGTAIDATDVIASMQNADGTTSTATKLANIAKGDVSSNSKDAINGSQLFAQGEGVKNIIGGNTTYNPSTGAYENNDIGGTGKGNINDAIQTVNTKADANATEIAKGLNFGANDQTATAGDAIKRQLGETIGIKGGITDTSTATSGENVITRTDANGNINIELAKNAKFDSVTTGNTLVDNSGITIKAPTGGTTTDVKLTAGGLDNGGNKITNVAAGTDATDAVNKDQLDKAQAAATTKVTEGKNVTVAEQTNTDGSKTYTVATKDDVNFNSVTAGSGANQVVLGDDGVKVGGNTYISDAGLNANDKKITNVANGNVTSTSKDAINGSQLRNTADDIASIIGGNATVDNAGNVTASNIGGTTATTIDDAIKTVKTTVKSTDNTIKVTANTADATNGTVFDISVDAQKLAESAQLPVVYTDADGNKVYKVNGKFTKDPTGQDASQEVTATNVIASMQNADGTISPTTLANIKAGTNDTDAVNVSQLKGAVDALGGGAAINTDGTIKAPTYNITNPADGSVITANNVGDALSSLNDAVNSPLTFKGDSGEFNRNLGQTTTVKGGITDTAKLSDNNIGVVAKDGALDIKLAKDIAVDSVKTGDTTVNTYGVSIANADPNKVVSLTAGGLNNGNNRITNVAAGQAGTDAVNKDQLDKAQAAATTKVAAGDNIVVTPSQNADGSTTYTVATADEVAFDKATVGNVTIDSTTNKISGLANGDVSASSTDAVNGSQLFATNQNVANNATAIANNAALIAKGINFGGTTGSNNYALGDTINIKGDSNISSETIAGGVQLKLSDVISVGTAKPVKIDGTKGTVGGLTNTTWDANNIVSGQAATEDQLKSAVSAAQAAATTKVVEGKNVKVSEQTNADGSKTYTVATADDVSFNSVTAGTGANAVVLDNKGVNVGGKTYISDAGLNANDKKVTNVANGGVTSTSKDAINGSQLRNTADDIATIIGGNAAVDNEGNVTASNIGGTGKNNINDAIEAVNTAATKAKTTVTQGKNIVVTETTNTDGSTNYKVATADNLDVTSVKAGNTTINNAGVTVGNNVALTDIGLSAGDVKVTTGGINAGGNKITGVAAGDISATSTDAVNGSQLNAVNQRILNIIGGKDDGYYDANGNLTEAGQLALKTYNVQGQSEFVHNSVVSAIKNINEQGTKFFHTNEGQSFTSEATNSEDSSAGGKYSTAIGYQAATTAEATNGLAVGTQSKAAGENAVALGYQAQANGTNTISIGTGNIVNGNNSGAIGDPSVIDGANSYSVGNNNSIAASSDNVFILGNDVNIAANTSGAVALGNKASVTTAGSVALGEGSTAGAANIAGGTANNAYTFGAYNDANVAAKPTTSTSVVAVGSKGNERQIQHVAAGVVSATSTDAINGSQLYYTNRALGKLADVVNKNNLDLRAGVAGANAAAGLPQVYLPGKSMVAASAGTYRGQSALAVGYSRSSDNGKLVLKVQGNANTRGEVGGSVGIGYQW